MSLALKDLLSRWENTGQKTYEELGKNTHQNETVSKEQ